MTTTLLWFRRDFRLTDNPALEHALERALQESARIVPVYIHAPEEEGEWAPGGATRWWQHHSLARLSEALGKLGAPLVIRRGVSLVELRRLIAETGADAVCWNRLYEPALIARDTAVKQALREQGIDAQSFNSALLVEPWVLKTGGGDPYRVFTPFWKNAQGRLPTRSIVPAPKSLPPHAVQGLPLEALDLLPKINWDAGFYQAWTPGEAGAQAQLQRFCKQGVAIYSDKRDWPAVAATSSLSPHLHFGEIGPLQVVARLQRLLAERHAAGLVANTEHFIRELGWREFAHHLLFHYPQTTLQPLHPRFAEFPWRRAQDYADDLHRWQRGQTGIPIVDAGMRQLWHTGWMHNRVRMIVASLLTKNLLIPWQQGARWFWDTLVDASLANNTLGWQWSAGCGADAAPYFRVFNPALQSAKFDPEGDYLRRWVPELKPLAGPALHAPWDAKAEVLTAAGVGLGDAYPRAIVELGASRERALQAYAAVKG